MLNKKNKVIRYSGIALIVIGIVVISYPFYTNFVMKRREVDILNAWENQLDLSVAQETAETGSTSLEESATATDESGNIIHTHIEEETSGGKTTPVATSKTPIFKITIPKINSEWVVYEGTDIPTLKSGPGHYVNTAMPGEPGACLIAGHRTTYGAPFNRVGELLNGDQIILETKENGQAVQYVYLVTGMVEVIPTDLSPIQQTSYPSLILSTCTPKFYATRRLLVFANIEQWEQYQ